MKKRIYLITSLIITSSIFFARSFAYQELIIRNYDNKPVRIIKVVLDGQHFVVNAVALTGGATLETLTKSVGGTTSLNGVFFCPEDYSSCDETHTISERVFLGEGEKFSTYRGDTGIRAIFGFDSKGDPLFVQKNLGYMTGLELNFNEDKLEDLYFGLGNFPVLLYEGEDVLRGSEHEIDNKMRSTANKHFICSNEAGDMIYMGAVGGMSIYQIPAFIKKHFDCYNALFLDAGYSAGMIYEEAVLQRGQRRMIMDAFVVLTREEYQELTHINPPNKTPYDPGPQYQLTMEDLKFIEQLQTIVDKILKNKTADYKRNLISLFRRAISAPKYASPQDQARFHELLLRMFTIDHL